MTDPRPEPLVPAEVDLRGMPRMLLDTVRLLDSDLFAISNGDEFKAAVALWCKSWYQPRRGDEETPSHRAARGHHADAAEVA